jgi:hypothetical protein
MYCRKLQERKMTITEFTAYLGRLGLPFDKSYFGCVGPSCRATNDGGVHFQYIDEQFVDDILNKLRINPSNVLTKEKHQYLGLLARLPKEVIDRIKPNLYWDTNPDYSKLVDLFDTLNIPCRTNQSGMFIDKNGMPIIWSHHL